MTHSLTIPIACWAILAAVCALLLNWAAAQNRS